LNKNKAGQCNTSSYSVSCLKTPLGGGLLLLARREFRKRPEPGVEREMPKWMKRVDGLTPVQALGAGAVLGAANPKNLALTVGAAAGLGQLGLSTADAAVSLIVFVVVGSLTVA